MNIRSYVFTFSIMLLLSNLDEKNPVIKHIQSKISLNDLYTTKTLKFRWFRRKINKIIERKLFVLHFECETYINENYNKILNQNNLNYYF